MGKKSFEIPPPTKEIVDKIVEIRRAYDILLNMLEDLPTSRHMSLAKSNLETSLLWAERSTDIYGVIK